VTLTTTNQAIYRTNRFVRNKRLALKRKPQRFRFCKVVRKINPKKPCSARRSVTLVIFRKDTTKVHCHIPGVQHNLNKNDEILIHRHRVLDLPSVHYRVLRFVDRKKNRHKLRPPIFASVLRRRSKVRLRNFLRFTNKRKTRRVRNYRVRD
jgi:small subunit ribosomal protein S12